MLRPSDILEPSRWFLGGVVADAVGLTSLSVPRFRGVVDAPPRSNGAPCARVRTPETAAAPPLGAGSPTYFPLLAWVSMAVCIFVFDMGRRDPCLAYRVGMVKYRPPRLGPAAAPERQYRAMV